MRLMGKTGSDADVTRSPGGKGRRQPGGDFGIIGTADLHIHKLADALLIKGKGHGKDHLRMRVEPLGLPNRKSAAFDGAPNGALEIEVRNVPRQPCFFKEHSYGQHERFPPRRFAPQPEHWVRQSGVVSAARAFSDSRTKNARLTPQSMWSHGSSSSYARRRAA